MGTHVDKGRAGATHELKGLEVFEVSLVDRPANLRPFLVVKNAETDMPKGAPLSEDEQGNLTDSTPTEKAWDPSRKKKLKSALSGAMKTLGALVEAIEDSDDEDAFMKRVAAVSGSLGGMGGKPKPEGEEEKGKGGDKPAKKTEESADDAQPEDNFDLTALDNMEGALQGALDESAPAPEPSAAEKANAKRLDQLQSRLDSLTKATHTLTRVVKTSGGSRPASQAAPTGEQPHVPTTKKQVWKSDMNSPDIDPDEQFV